jgi:putative membrane protein
MIGKPTAAGQKNMMGGYGGWPMMAGWGMGWGIIGIIFWVLVVIVIIALFRTLCRGGRCHGWEDKNSAVKILKERYAKGEIDKKEYEEKMKDLS